MRTGRYVAFASVLVALVAAGPPRRCSRPTSRAPRSRCAAHGFYPGPIDGIRGPQTEPGSAERSNGATDLQVDGVVGRRTRARTRAARHGRLRATR